MIESCGTLQPAGGKDELIVQLPLKNASKRGVTGGGIGPSGRGHVAMGTYGACEVASSNFQLPDGKCH